MLAERIWRDGQPFDAILFTLLASDFDPGEFPPVYVDPEPNE